MGQYVTLLRDYTDEPGSVEVPICELDVLGWPYEVAEREEMTFDIELDEPLRFELPDLIILSPVEPFTIRVRQPEGSNTVFDSVTIEQGTS